MGIGTRMILLVIHFRSYFLAVCKQILSHDVVYGSAITPCNKIDKPLVVYRFSGNNVAVIMTQL